MEELIAQIVALEARVTALEQHAHSGHTLDTAALDAIATHVIGRFNEHLRSVFGKRAQPEPAAQEEPPAPQAKPVEQQI